MDRKFLKEITEGYITNHDVFSEFNPKQVDLIRETIYNDLCEVCDELRETNEELYNEVYFNNRFYQNDVFTNYLNFRYREDSDESLDEGVLAIASGLIGKIVTFISGLSPLGLMVTGVLLIVTLYKFNGIIGKKFYQFVKNVGSLFEKTGKILTKSGKHFQLRYAIIQKNFDHCYRQAGITDLNKINIQNYFNKYSGSKTFKGILDQKKANILINCYVEIMINMIKLQMVMYLNCIKSSKGYDQLSKLSTVEFMSYIQSSQYKSSDLNVNVMCAEYFDIATEQISKFDDFLEFFYETENERRQLTMRLHQSVQQARSEVQKVQKDTRKFSKYKN